MVKFNNERNREKFDGLVKNLIISNLIEAFISKDVVNTPVNVSTIRGEKMGKKLAQKILQKIPIDEPQTIIPPDSNIIIFIENRIREIELQNRHAFRLPSDIPEDVVSVFENTINPEPTVIHVPEVPLTYYQLFVNLVRRIFIKDNECKICCVNNNNKVLNCCNQSVCEECFNKVNRCPYCRLTIT